MPNVIIWATLLGYLSFTYFITSSRPSWQKSISKSGIDILSGFKKRSNINPNLMGSKSVIDKHQATKEPAPEPLPGPTGMLLDFAQFM